MHDWFRVFAAHVSNVVGSVWAVIVVIALVLSSGFYYEFSSDWKTNMSFLTSLSALLVLVFLQKSQNHSDKATHLKLDELIQNIEGARN
jgi:low affinity Fe/Cu permease